MSSNLHEHLASDLVTVKAAMNETLVVSDGPRVIDIILPGTRRTYSRSLHTNLSVQRLPYTLLARTCHGRHRHRKGKGGPHHRPAGKANNHRH